MTLRRDRRRGQKKYNKAHNVLKLLKPDSCLNCGQPGAHFVPPSGGGKFPGFFMCGAIHHD